LSRNGISENPLELQHPMHPPISSGSLPTSNAHKMHSASPLHQVYPDTVSIHNGARQEKSQEGKGDQEESC
jgi:hypothetical protein